MSTVTPRKSRHPNCKPLTVNTRRENTGAPVLRKPAPVMPDLDFDQDTNAPVRLSGGFHLMLTGQSRAGTLF